MTRDIQHLARQVGGTDPEPFEATPTTFRRVMAALALGAVAIGLGIAAVVGVWG